MRDMGSWGKVQEGGMKYGSKPGGWSRLGKAGCGICVNIFGSSLAANQQALP